MANDLKGDGIGINILGAPEVVQAVEQVKRGVRNRVIKRATNKGARVVVPALRQATPRAKKLHGKQAAKNPPGTLRRATGVVFRSYRGGEYQAAYVGHKWPKGAAAHLVEFGTTDRFRKGVRRGYTGVATAHPFFRPVWRSKKSQVASTMRLEILAGLWKEIEKAKTKGTPK